MAIVAHVFPKFHAYLMSRTTGSAFTSDTLKAALYGTGTVTWGSTVESSEFVSDWLTNTSLTEITGTGYTAGGVTLSSVSLNQTNQYETLVVGVDPVWTNASFTANFALFYDSSPGSNATNPIICYWDFGGPATVSSGTFTLNIGTSNGVGQALVQWVSS